MGEKKAEVPVGKELVRMTGIMKEFPGVKALDNVKQKRRKKRLLAMICCPGKQETLQRPEMEKDRR